MGKELGGHFPKEGKQMRNKPPEVPACHHEVRVGQAPPGRRPSTHSTPLRKRALAKEEAGGGHVGREASPRPGPEGAELAPPPCPGAAPWKVEGNHHSPGSHLEGRTGDREVLLPQGHRSTRTAQRRLRTDAVATLETGAPPEHWNITQP